MSPRPRETQVRERRAKGIGREEEGEREKRKKRGGGGRRKREGGRRKSTKKAVSPSSGAPEGGCLLGLQLGILVHSETSVYPENKQLNKIVLAVSFWDKILTIGSAFGDYWEQGYSRILPGTAEKGVGTGCGGGRRELLRWAPRLETG